MSATKWLVLLLGVALFTSPRLAAAADANMPGNWRCVGGTRSGSVFYTDERHFNSYDELNAFRLAAATRTLTSLSAV